MQTLVAFCCYYCYFDNLQKIYTISSNTFGNLSSDFCFNLFHEVTLVK